MRMTDSGIETPSGKGAGDENFPVGSFLLPARLRPHVARYYRFARAIDDIADNPELAPEDKVRRLELFAGALISPEAEGPGLETATELRESLAETGVPATHGLDLITAFKRDAVKSRTQDWADLLDYCNYSANPVGRYLLDLHGESPDGYPAADALCSALQVLNHLQDCQEDYLELDRVYLPQDWLTEEGLDCEVLKEKASPPSLRRVFDRCLDGVDVLLLEAAPLAQQMKSLGLAMESQVIFRLARRLAKKLRGGDPLAGRVALTKLDFLAAGFIGPLEVLARRLFRGKKAGSELSGKTAR